MKRFISMMALGLCLGAVSQGCVQRGDAATAPPTISSIGPNGVILLMPGRTITVAGGIGAAPTLVSEMPAGPNPFVTLSLPDREIRTEMPSRGDGEIPPDGQTTFTLWTDPKGPTFVRIENGREQPMVYVAHHVLREGGELKTYPAATCAVRGRGAGLESRADGVAAMRIVGMVAVKDPDICYDASTDKSYKVAAPPATE